MLTVYLRRMILVTFILLNTQGCGPIRGYSSEAEKGQHIFNGEGKCFYCHGKDADGQTGVQPIATQGQPKPPDLRKQESLQYTHSGDIYRFLKQRLHGPVRDEELWQLIAFLHMIRNSSHTS